jgi:hypothetical protein
VTSQRQDPAIPRGTRYALAIAVVIAGIMCGAVIPGTLGGTICTVLVAAGLIPAAAMAFRDLGLTDAPRRDRGRRR